MHQVGDVHVYKGGVHVHEGGCMSLGSPNLSYYLKIFLRIYRDF